MAVLSIERLKDEADTILDRVLTRKPLVKAGEWLRHYPDLKALFDRAGALYRVGSFGEAKRLFEEIAKASDEQKPGMGLIPVINAAACAAATEDFHYVLKTVGPLYERNIAFGHPLWNLALAHYRTGDVPAASAAIRHWTFRASHSEKARGWLVGAALCAKGGDIGRAVAQLEEAESADANLSATLLGASAGTHALPASEPQLSLGIASAISSLKRARLLRLIQPKKPERRPSLAVILSPQEMETFSTAVENMSEGKAVQARAILHELQRKHSQEPHLKMALAASELFAGRVDAGRQILLELERPGHRLTGSAYWNLACTELHLDNAVGALRALTLCSETEYRTNSAVWQAISELTEQERSSVRPQPSKHKISPETEAKPLTLPEIRQGHLRRLIRARLQPSQYTPDLGGLVRRDLVAIEQILKDARKVEPSAAYRMLVPWMTQHPKSYTLKVHAAAYALAAELIDDAKRCLEDADSIRPLDRISRYNLAYIYLQRSDFRRIAEVLLDASNSSVAETSDYWLALAIARVISGVGDASDAAARALLAASSSQNPAVSEALRQCRIKPAEHVSSVDVPTVCAREVLSFLDHGDVARAQERLLSLFGTNFEEIPEVGKRALQPYFERKLNYKKIKAQPSTERAFNSALKKFEDENFAEAAQQFSRLLEDQDYADIALNAIAAHIWAKQYDRARRLARRAMARHGRKVYWKLAYNSALAEYLSRHYRSAVNILEHRPDRSGRSVTALVLLSAKEGIVETPSLRAKALEALQRLRESVAQPSRQLLLAHAWLHLIQNDPETDNAKALLSDVIHQADIRTGIPAQELNSMRQVRTLYQQMRAAGGNAPLRFLKEIVDVREEERAAERDELRGRRLAINIGVELTALACLAAEHQANHDRWQAIQTLDQYETLVQAHEDKMEPGFVTSDWLELGRLSLDMQLPWAASRRADRGLRIDPERTELKKLKESAVGLVRPAAGTRLGSELSGLSQTIGSASGSPSAKVVDLRRHFRECGVLELEAPLTWDRLWRLLNEIDHNPERVFETEDLPDQVLTAARAELPSEALGPLEIVLTWILENFSQQQFRSPLELEVYEDKIWPRSFEGEACGLVVISCAGREPTDVSVIDRQQGSVVWEGHLDPGQTVYRRWTFEREEGFVSDEQFELQLTAQFHGGKQLEFPLMVTVGPLEPTWPDYPAGSLHPSEVPGGDLYGRGQFIRQIIGSFGSTRNRANYLIESVRQMGKTTLLFFIKSASSIPSFSDVGIKQ